LRPAAALALAAALGLLPPRVVIYGLEAASREPGAELSADVAAAIPEAVRRIEEELDWIAASQVQASVTTNGGGHA
jgi:hypothetical protein